MNMNLKKLVTAFAGITFAFGLAGSALGAITGTGTSSDPYLINDATDLATFRDNVNSGNNYSGKYIKLTTDIDLNNEEWEPIGGPQFWTKVFSGNFDGDGHTVSNLKVVKTAEGSYAGFFGHLEGGSIRNLTIHNADVSGVNNCAAIVGLPYTGTVDNCKVTGLIKITASGYDVGGIGGGYYGIYGTISNCEVSGSEGSFIYGMNAGGIAGYLGEGVTGGKIISCKVDGVRIGAPNGSNVAGIIGMPQYGNVISNCTVGASTVIVSSGNDSTRCGLIAGRDLSSAANGPVLLVDNIVEGGAVAKLSDETPVKVQMAAHAEGATAYAIVGKDIVYDSSKKIIGGQFEQAPESALAEGYILGAKDSVTGLCSPKEGHYCAALEKLSKAKISAAISEASDAVYLDMWNFWGMQGMVDADGNECPQFVPITDNTMYRDTAVDESNSEAWVSAKYIFDNYFATGKSYAGYQTTYLYEDGYVSVAKYETFAEAITAAEATDVALQPRIAVLDATAEQTNPEWKIAGGYLVKKVNVAQIVTNNGATTNKYETLAEAFAAAQSGDSVTALNLDGDPSLTKVADGFYQSANTYGAATDFYITSKAGLEYFRDLVNGVKTVVDGYLANYASGTTVVNFYQGNIFSGKTVHLLEDIDLENEDWTPIGYVHKAATEDAYGYDKELFYGNFDGHGHTISNLKVVSSSNNSKSEYGLFGRIGAPGGANQTFANLTIENVNVASGSYVGAFVGNCQSNPVTFDNCTVTGTISLNGYYTGALYGIGSGNVFNSEVAGTAGSTISGTSFAGALVGSERGGTGLSITNNSVSDVTVSSSQFAGGLVGAMANGASGTLVVLDNDSDATLSGSGATNEFLCPNNGSTTAVAVGADATFDENGKITGGIFETIDEKLIASGYITDDNPDSETSDSYPLIIGGPYVASIEKNGNTTYYATLADAIAAAQSGDTITLITDVVVDTQINLSNPITFDLGGNTITSAANNRVFKIATAVGDYAFKNGIVNTTNPCYGLFRVDNASTVTVEGITTTNNRSWGCNFRVAGGAQVLVTNCTITATDGGGIYAEGGSTVDVYDSTIAETGTATDCNASAFAVGEGATITVHSGTYSGEYGAFVCSSGGMIDVLGGSVTGRRYAFESDARAGGNEDNSITDSIIRVSGGTIDGELHEEIQIYNNATLTYANKMQISGGAFSNYSATGPTADNAGYEISGGIFDAEPASQHVVDGFMTITNPDSTTVASYPYAVVAAVAQVISANGATTNKFSTVMEALSAATTGSTIELLADVDENVTLASWKNNALTIDLGGHTLTGQIIAPYGAKTEGIVIKNGSIVGRDSSSFYCLQFGYGSGNATLENLSITQVSQNYRSYAVFFQQTSKSVTLRNVTLDGRFYTANSQSTIAIESGVYQNSTGLTSSEISNGGVIAARGGTFYYNPTTPNNLVADGYVAIETNDVTDVQCWVVELGPAFAIVTFADSTEAEFWDLDEAISALAEGATLTIKPGTYNLANANYTLPKNVTIVGVEENGSRVLIKSKPTFNSANGLTIQNIDFDGGYSWTPPAVTVHGDATFKNCTITGENAVYYSTVNGKLTFDGCTLTADTYALNVGEGTGDVFVKDCTISGWTSFGNTGKTVITGTTFEEGDYNYVRFYQDAVIDDCTFNTNMAININTTGKRLIVSDSAFEDGSSIASVIGEGENDDPVANNYVAVGTNVQLDENGDIVGGIFETIDDELIATGYLSVDNLESATAERYPLTVGGPFTAVIVDDNGKFVHGYATLQEAFDEAETSGEKTEIVLVGDAIVEGTDTEFYVAYNWVADVVLDLNGHDVINTCTDSAAGQQHVIVNEGTLTIKDSQDDGTKGGCVYTMTVAQRGNHVIANSGTLTIEGGWFGDSDNDKANANDLSVGHAVYNTGTAVINGGHFTAVDNNFTVSPNRYAYVLCSDNDGATMTINDADVYGAMNGVISATKGGDVTINDGNFYLGRANATTHVYRLIYTTGSSVVEVNGGNWTANNSQKTGEEDFKGSGTSQILLKGGTFTLQNGFPYAQEGACGVAVSGGVYSKVVPDYCCDPDYSPAANSDPATSAAYPYTVEAKGVAKIVKNGTTTYYASLTLAYNASVSGDMIELLADDHSLADGSELFINHSVTITGAVDENGKPKYTIYGKNDGIGDNDIFIRDTTASDTITISNVVVAQFGNVAALAGASQHAPIYVGGSNKAKVVIDNVWVSEFNRTGIMMSGSGEFEIRNCHIDGERTHADTLTSAIEVHRGAHGIIADTTVTNITSTFEEWSGVCLGVNGQGAISVTNCTFVAGENGDGIGTAENNTEGACTSIVTIEDSSFEGEFAMCMNVAGAQFVVTSGTYTGYLGLKDDIGNSAPYAISGGYYDREVPKSFCADDYVPAPQDPVTGLYTVRIGFAKDDEVVVVGDSDYPLTQTEADFLNALLDDEATDYGKDDIETALAGMSVDDFKEATLLNIDIVKTYNDPTYKPTFSITAIKRNRTAGTVSVTVTLDRKGKEVSNRIYGILVLKTSSDGKTWGDGIEITLNADDFGAEGHGTTAIFTMPAAPNAKLYKAMIVDSVENTSGTGE